MITSDTLLLKLKLQSQLLAKSFNLPSSFGYDLLASSIYQHHDFEELCDSIAEFNYVSSFGALSEYQKLKYVLIVLVKLHKTHLLWTAQIQLESSHHLMYAA